MDNNLEILENKIIDQQKQKVKIHALYLAVIFVLLCVFLILLAPNYINPKAFENFSFASTIVSIVLAVVSIVFSFRIGKSSGDNIAGIREIERGIEDRLRRFDSIKTEIEDVIVSNTKPITDEVGSIRKDQENIRDMFEKAMGSHLEHSRGSGSKERTNDIKSSTTTPMGVVSMLLCALSSENNKEVHMDDLIESIQRGRLYIWGYTAALHSLFPADIEVSFDSNTLSVKKYNAESLGTSKEWRDRLSHSKNEFAKSMLKSIDEYFITDAS